MPNKIDTVWKTLHADKAMPISILAALLALFIQDPRTISRTIEIADDNKQQLIEHRKTDAHHGARERLGLIEQEQEFIRRQLTRTLDAIKTSADLSSKTNQLLQKITTKAPLQ